MTSSWLALGASAVLVAGCGGSLEPTAWRPSATNVSLAVEPLASGFSALTFAANAGDGSGALYAVEQAGRIRIAKPGTLQPDPPFLDISDRVSSGGERGLLGLAFHPDFESNGRFFVDYTDRQGDSVISEFTRAANGTVDSGAERVLLHVEQPFANHNGGMLAFGSDGYLYIGLGDGGSGGDPHGNGQNRATYLGKILRIDVDDGDPYSIPADNPLVAADANALGEIWDYGLRNPWRFSFDRQTGALFIADVGQSAWEEVNVEPADVGGHNYGWNIMEASHCYDATSCDVAGLTLPVAEYSHDQGCSVIGGYVYRGNLYPELAGSYVFSDLCSHTLWIIDAAAALQSAGRQEPQVVGRLDFSPSSFGQDESGELYVVDTEGAIYRLVASSSD